MPQVMVADVLCGGGKTSAAINLINSSPPAQKFLFVTPYLDECTRIIQSCPERRFEQPDDEKPTKCKKSKSSTGKATKLGDMRRLLYERRNIASTHALFPRYTEDMLNILRDEHYLLIIDESYEVTKPLKTEERNSFFDELKKGTLSVAEDGCVSWIADPPSLGTPLRDLYYQIVNGGVYLYGNRILVWLFPKEILMSFDRIIILTYMFSAQSMRYYLDALGIDYSYIGTKKNGDCFQFCPIGDPDMIRQCQIIKGQIHIVDKPKLNRIGDDRLALSSGWFDRDASANDGRGVQELARNIRNVQKHVFKCPNRDFMWTVYKAARQDVEDKNLKKTFVPFNKRAVNTYRHCKYLAYGINLFAQPDAYNYFKHMGIEMDVEKWALSEMIQWIWRSAIRDGEDIYIYIPSSRMRRLLKEWLEEISAVANEAA